MTVEDLIGELRQRHLVPDLTHIRYCIYFPPYRHGPLELDKNLASIGVHDLSTLYLRFCILGGACRDRWQQDKAKENVAPTSISRSSKTSVRMPYISLPRPFVSSNKTMDPLATVGNVEGVQNFMVLEPGPVIDRKGKGKAKVDQKRSTGGFNAYKKRKRDIEDDIGLESDVEDDEQAEANLFDDEVDAELHMLGLAILDQEAEADNERELGMVCSRGTSDDRDKTAERSSLKHGKSVIDTLKSSARTKHRDENYEDGSDKEYEDYGDEDYEDCEDENKDEEDEDYEDDRDDVDNAGYIMSSGSSGLRQKPRISKPVQKAGAFSSADPPSLCTFKGQTCSCSAADHHKDSYIPAQSHVHIDRRCQILNVLALSFHTYHRYIICLGCSSFVPLDDLFNHLKRYHPEILADVVRLESQKWSFREANKNWPLVVGHFVKSLAIDPGQKTIVFTPETLNGPVHGIGKPQLRYPCPARCGHWAKDPDFSRSHYNRSCRPKNTGPPDIDDIRSHAHLTQTPFSIYRNMAQVVPVNGPLDDTDQQASSAATSLQAIQRYQVPQGVESFRPPWLRQLGWAAWRDEQIDRGLSMEQLVAFVALPPRLRPWDIMADPPSREQIFNWVAHRIAIRLRKMLEDANTWLNASNPELRSALTAQ